MIDNGLFSPGQIYKDQKIMLENFLTDINDFDMIGIDSTDVKNDLINKWKY